jgi:hypothetical protein
MHLCYKILFVGFLIFHLLVQTSINHFFVCNPKPNFYRFIGIVCWFCFIKAVIILNGYKEEVSMYRYSESIDVVKYAQAIFCKASNAVEPKTIQFIV